MAFRSGKDGRLLIDGQIAAKVVDWSFTTTVPSLVTTTLGDTDSTNTPGVRTTSGSCTVFYQSSANLPNSASVLLNNILKAASDGQGAESTKVTLRLVIENGTASPNFIEGEALLTSASMTMSVGAVLSAQVQFEFDGAPRSMNL